LQISNLKHSCLDGPHETPESKPQELQERLVSFSAEIIDLTGKLPEPGKAATSPSNSCVAARQQRQTTPKRAVPRVDLISFTSFEWF
jgi:hypothetical protein